MHTVLLASDEPHRTIYTMLFQEAGFRVSEAKSLEELVTRARKERPSVVVVDLMSEATDGPRAVERIDQTEEPPAIVLLRRRGGGRIDPEGLRARTRILDAPCSPRTVLEAVERLARPPAQQDLPEGLLQPERNAGFDELRN